ncbi:FAD-dependent oxidoreductase [Clostridium sp. YIM B02555]|uniref:FAD-dependent oxidoreductase n=1 Tax=Clostridium sp. YIM B02555 TaxID=2911968 RepID=UPI001EEDADB9|nr:FAD-dependent oxidoreductase [Clostridium sp. YIM B02555]
MNTVADEELINNINPDAVIIAVGAHPLVPKIPGIETAMNALEAYDSINRIGKKVVLVGGGLVGCEVGLHLANEGSDVTVVEMNTMMAYETFGYYRNALLDEMDKRSIKQVLGAKCLEFKKNGILVSKDGQESFIEADTVIFSMGMKSNLEVVESLKEACKERNVYVIGDSKKPGKVGDSVRDGYMTAMSII